MGRLIDANSVYNAIQITTDNFGVAKHVVETNMLDMLAKIPTVEAIPKADYEARLKADMIAMFTELQTEIEEIPTNRMAITDSSGLICCGHSEYEPTAKDASKIIQQKIDSLRGA